ncbi:hypothetical protein ACTI_23370 [Actinoplanes sp. OR16]|uniref:hypothetical protein n=1 Tax=Actinoplanes sp. OR16 TaxID=946334 RepID=UPI000F6B4968|nr:hypothetical protein [Actinoplanes sp. OR16]BBH65652.1 hypothetical protein ACTI_23370 [Actinoplanes sp. OR16]
MDSGLKRELEAKVYAGERLTRAEGIALLESDDLAWLGRLAHHRRSELHGERVLFRVGGEHGDEGQPVSYGDPGEPHRFVDDVLALRERQDRTGGVVAVVPQPHESVMPAQTLQAFAVARLLLDNVPHLQSRGASVGQSVAQLSLNFGADDLGVADPEEKDDLLHLIWDAGFRPIERDADFAIVEEHAEAVPFAERRSEPQRVWA